MAAWNSGEARLCKALVGVVCVLSAACVEKSPRREMGDDAGASLGVASARPGAATVSEVESLCSSICERSRVLRCPRADDCMLNCVGSASGTPCNAEFQAFYRCLVPQPIKNWECAEDGVAAIKSGFCEKEQENAVRCMETKAKP
jgi:hypothetical protein